MLTVNADDKVYSLNALEWIPFTAYSEMKPLVGPNTEVCIVKGGNFAVFRRYFEQYLKANCDAKVRHGLRKLFNKILKED